MNDKIDGSYMFAVVYMAFFAIASLVTFIVGGRELIEFGVFADTNDMKFFAQATMIPFGLLLISFIKGSEEPNKRNQVFFCFHLFIVFNLMYAASTESFDLSSIFIFSFEGVIAYLMYRRDPAGNYFLRLKKGF